jgi:hypothetical protein
LDARLATQIAALEKALVGDADADADGGGGHG